MTLDFQAALPEVLAQKIARTALERGLPLWDFFTLLFGLFALPQIRLSEAPAVRDLSDELMLFCQQRATGIEQESGKIRVPVAEKLTPEQIREELKNWKTPQSLDELKPRDPAPNGMTAMQFIRGQWPGDETDTDEEILAELKAMG